jgi:hypothetical protein
MCCWDIITYKRKVHNGKIEIISFVLSFLTGSHYQFRIFLNFFSSWICMIYLPLCVKQPTSNQSIKTYTFNNVSITIMSFISWKKHYKQDRILNTISQNTKTETITMYVSTWLLLCMCTSSSVIQMNLVTSNSVYSKFRLSRNFSEVPF